MFDVQRTERPAWAAEAPTFVGKQDDPGNFIEVIRDSLKKEMAQNDAEITANQNERLEK